MTEAISLSLGEACRLPALAGGTMLHDGECRL